VTFISIHSVIIYVVSFGACMRCTRLCPLKPGVIVYENEVLIVALRNMVIGDVRPQEPQEQDQPSSSTMVHPYSR
jgi:hypothetical protein